MSTQRIPFRLNYKRLSLWLVVYWLVTTVPAGFLVRMEIAERDAAKWITYVMLATVIVCMVTERGQWKGWQRVGYVVVAWLGEAILAGVVALTVGRLGFISLDLLYRFLHFTASLPFVLFAMRQSRLFVVPGPTSPMTR